MFKNYKQEIIGASLSEPHTDDDIQSRVLYINIKLIIIRQLVWTKTT